MSQAQLKLVHAPHPIFKKKAQAIEHIDDQVKDWINQMFEIMAKEQGIGMGANMVGLLKRIVVINMRQDDQHHKYAMINPVITEKSDETQTFEEASLSFLGISANVTRPSSISVTFLNEDGQSKTIRAEGFLATVIQHEIDYLDGITFLDHLSKLRRDRLIKKIQTNCGCC